MRKLIAAFILFAISGYVEAAVHEDEQLMRAHTQHALTALLTGGTKPVDADRHQFDQLLWVSNADRLHLILSADLSNKRHYFQMSFKTARTSNGWLGVDSRRLEKVMELGSEKRQKDIMADIKRLRGKTTRLQKERRELMAKARGRISCTYGNRGGYCEVTDSTSQYWFGLSEANPVTWFFEGVELPTTKLEDVDIVMPTFEKKALTHFQDCFAEVIRREDNIHVRIKIEGCAHSRQVYEPLLNLSKQ